MTTDTSGSASRKRRILPGHAFGGSGCDAGAGCAGVADARLRLPAHGAAEDRSHHSLEDPISGLASLNFSPANFGNFFQGFSEFCGLLCRMHSFPVSIKKSKLYDYQHFQQHTYGNSSRVCRYTWFEHVFIFALLFRGNTPPP